MVSQGRGFCLYTTFSLGPDALGLKEQKTFSSRILSCTDLRLARSFEGRQALDTETITAATSRQLILHRMVEVGRGL